MQVRYNCRLLKRNNRIFIIKENHEIIYEECENEALFEKKKKYSVSGTCTSSARVVARILLYGLQSDRGLFSAL